jgi:hypothetical protein
VFDQARSEYPNTLLLCGIGAAVSDLADWRASFRQAGQALEMSRRLQARQPLYFPDLSVYRLLFQIEHSPELILFQEEMLIPGRRKTIRAAVYIRKLLCSSWQYLQTSRLFSSTATP